MTNPTIKQALIINTLFQRIQLSKCPAHLVKPISEAKDLVSKIMAKHQDDHTIIMLINGGEEETSQQGAKNVVMPKFPTRKETTGPDEEYQQKLQ